MNAPDAERVFAVRSSKTAVVTASALLFSLVVFGNVTDHGTNLAFIRHVMAMDTIFPDATTRYRAVTSPGLQQAAYALIIGVEIIAAALCWAGAIRMLGLVRGSEAEFRDAKSWAIAGLTVALVLWQVGLIGMGSEWFGMWMSTQWNGVDSAFRFVMMTLGALIYVALSEGAG